MGLIFTSSGILLLRCPAAYGGPCTELFIAGSRHVRSNLSLVHVVGGVCCSGWLS